MRKEVDQSFSIFQPFEGKEIIRKRCINHEHSNSDRSRPKDQINYRKNHQREIREQNYDIKKILNYRNPRNSFFLTAPKSILKIYQFFLEGRFMLEALEKKKYNCRNGHF
jgi:hypothetical protein